MRLLRRSRTVGARSRPVNALDAQQLQDVTTQDAVKIGAGQPTLAEARQVLERLAIGAVTLDVGHVRAPDQALATYALVEGTQAGPQLVERERIGSRPVDRIQNLDHELVAPE